MLRGRPYARVACVTLGVAWSMLGGPSAVVAAIPPPATPPPIVTPTARPNAAVAIPNSIDSRHLPGRNVPSRGMPGTGPLDPKVDIAPECAVSALAFTAGYSQFTTVPTEARSDVVVSCRNVHTELRVVVEVPSSKRGLALVGATPDDKLVYDLSIVASGVTDNGNVESVTLVLDPEPGGTVRKHLVLGMRIAPKQPIRAGISYHGDTPIRITY